VATSTITRICSALEKSIVAINRRKTSRAISGIWVPTKAATRILLR